MHSICHLQQENYKGSRSCVEFTSEQYHHIYKANFLESVRTSLFSKTTQLEDTTDVACKWNRYQSKIQQ